MIGNVELEGFQAFGLNQDLSLRPLTLLFGPNSAGKSSIGRALRFLKQSGSHPTGISFAGDHVDLTSFENSVFKNQQDDHINLSLLTQPLKAWTREPRGWIAAIGYWWKFSSEALPVPASITVRAFIYFGDQRPKPEQLRTQSPEMVELKFAHTPEGLVLDSFMFSNPDVRSSGQFYYPTAFAGWGIPEGDDFNEVNLLDQNDLIVNGLAENGETTQVSVAELLDQFAFQVGPDEGRAGPASNLVPRPKRTKSSDRSSLSRFVADLLVQSGTVLEQELSNIRYVGPLREVSGGFRSDEGDVPELSADGSNIQEHLLRISDDQFTRVSDGIRFLTEDVYSLERKSLRDSEIVQARTLGSVFLRDRHSDTQVAFQDAGTGIAQVLPIVAAVVDIASESVPNQSLRNRRSANAGLLLIEQPELHLHPAMQSRLADYLLDNSMESIYRPSSRPIILCETHSEAFLLRVQRRLRERKFGAPEDKVSCYFVDRLPGSDSSHAMWMEIDEDGEFRQAWPLSFAGLRMQEYRGG